MEVLRRSVDDRGRVVLPIRGVKEVFVAKVGDVIVVSARREKVEEVVDILGRAERERMLKALKEWFDLVEEAGLDKLSAKDLDELVSRAVLRELR